MTAQQIIIWSLLYLVELGVVVYLTRATRRRVIGASVGGAAAGLVALVAITLCKALGWWQVPFGSTTYSLLLFYFALALWPAPVYLVTWRLVRRFGWHGLTIFVAFVALIGPPRDYLIAVKFPKWMVFAPGVAPILADAATYIAIIVVGHGVMRLVAGRKTRWLPSAEHPRQAVEKLTSQTLRREFPDGLERELTHTFETVREMSPRLLPIEPGTLGQRHGG